jgi:hypothetical protein
MESGSLRANPRAIAFGILRELSLICHPEERSDEGSAAAFQPISGRWTSWLFQPHRKAEK